MTFGIGAHGGLPDVHIFHTSLEVDRPDDRIYIVLCMFLCVFVGFSSTRYLSYAFLFFMFSKHANYLAYSPSSMLMQKE